MREREREGEIDRDKKEGKRVSTTFSYFVLRYKIAFTAVDEKKTEREKDTQRKREGKTDTKIKEGGRGGSERNRR